MKTKNKFFFLILVFNILNSCAPAYIPNVLNAPLLSNKGEYQCRFNGGISGFDPQMSYAFTDHIGVMLNGSFNYRNDSDKYHKHFFIESGAGYYSKIQDAGRFDIFGGYGFGDIKTNVFWLDGWNNYADGYYHRIFLQPSIGAVTNVFEGNLSTRLVLVNMHFRNIPENYAHPDNSLTPFIEPVITAKVGYKYIKYVVQVGFSLPLTNNYIYLYEYQPFIFSMGINLKLGEKYNEK